MKEENKLTNNRFPTVKAVEKTDDKNEIMQFLFTETEEKVISSSLINVETEPREFLNGDIFTIASLNEEYKRFIAEHEKDYEPKFTLFLARLGKVCGWTTEEMSRFSKPLIAPVTIIEVIYNRFPDGLLNYMHANNRYVGYYTRRTKNYKLLNEDGIRKLETYIDDANILLNQCKNYYEFRIKMFEVHNVSYQMQMTI